MKISSEDLPRQLAKGLAPLYVVYGEALLQTVRELVQEDFGIAWHSLLNEKCPILVYQDRTF